MHTFYFLIKILYLSPANKDHDKPITCEQISWYTYYLLIKILVFCYWMINIFVNLLLANEYLSTRTGCIKKNAPPSLLNISATKYLIFKLCFSPENWDPYANFEYKTISVQYSGAEIFTKQNAVLKQIKAYLYCLKVPQLVYKIF